MIYTVLDYIARIVTALAMMTGIVSVVLVFPMLKKKRQEQTEINIVKNLFFSSVLARDFAFLIIIVLILTGLSPQASLDFSLRLIRLYACVSTGIFIVSTIQAFIHTVLTSDRFLKKYFFWVRVSCIFSAALGFIIVYIFE